jgi:hypothetical protein
MSRRHNSNLIHRAVEPRTTGATPNIREPYRTQIPCTIPRKCVSSSPKTRELMSYSIKSAARASSVWGIVIPSALAVLRLMTSSYSVGACTGRSAGFSPLRMRST